MEKLETIIYYRLCAFRSKGIGTIPGARLYLQLKQARDESMADVKAFQINSQFSWKIKNTTFNQLLPTGKKRGVFTPLDVAGLPSYEKLTIKERELCRNVRLVPLTYLELKDILIAEHKKMGHLKLQVARRLLKIDVNKTRRLYDFLVEEGYVNTQ